MFWETRLAELQKLAPVDFNQLAPGEPWAVTMRAAINEPYHGHSGVVATGATRAAAVVNLWCHIAGSGDPFTIESSTIGRMRVRWNGRWEFLEAPAPFRPIIEERHVCDFDGSD